MITEYIKNSSSSSRPLQFCSIFSLHICIQPFLLHTRSLRAWWKCSCFLASDQTLSVSQPDSFCTDVFWFESKHMKHSLLQAQCGLSTDIKNMPYSLDDCSKKTFWWTNYLCLGKTIVCILWWRWPGIPAGEERHLLKVFKSPSLSHTSVIHVNTGYSLW